jgi:hypothetical protein
LAIKWVKKEALPQRPNEKRRRLTENETENEDKGKEEEKEEMTSEMPKSPPQQKQTARLHNILITE